MHESIVTNLRTLQILGICLQITLKNQNKKSEFCVSIAVFIIVKNKICLNKSHNEDIPHLGSCVGSGKPPCPLRD